ncbi:MAG TPA: hypothetical protein VMX96_10180 [Dehalococcoidia bacterium]|nr:hypothetical protein [Dehalococcoidia bacterium]
MKVAHEDISIDIKAKAVALGVRFVEEDHGYMFHDPITKMAIGWWPLILRDEIEATLTYKGEKVPVMGLGYCEH